MTLVRRPVPWRSLSQPPAREGFSGTPPRLLPSRRVGMETLGVQSQQVGIAGSLRACPELAEGVSPRDHLSGGRDIAGI